MAQDTTSIAGTGTVTDPQRMAIMSVKEDEDGTKTYYTTGQKLQELSITEEEPDLENNPSGIYFQLPSSMINQ